MDDSGRGRGRGRGRGEEPGKGRGRGRGGDDGYELFGDEPLLTAHVLLGLALLLLGTVRLVWRLTTPLPPWAPTLGASERRLAHRTETALYAVTLAVPLSGLALVVSGDEGLLAAHVATHVVLFVAVALHIGLVLKHQFVDRDHLLRRML
ncbi:cytochrome b [Streptomyces sp. NPDC003327]